MRISDWSSDVCSSDPLNAENGDLGWTESGTLEVTGVFGVAAPAAGQGTVIVGYSSGELTAYRYENGRTLWGDALSRTSISTSRSEERRVGKECVSTFMSRW